MSFLLGLFQCFFPVSLLNKKKIIVLWKVFIWPCSK